MSRLYWNRREVKEDVALMLETLAEEYPLAEGQGEVKLEFVGADRAGVKVNDVGDKYIITYSSVATAARGVALAMAGLQGDNPTVFETIGIMLDASRNAVMTVGHVKNWLRRLALMGYNMAMLYTEDTYELPGEPYFGYLRGAYTLEEIQEIDRYGARLGIEVIGCIQTLGHLEQILKYGTYGDVRDTASVLMVDKPETYAFIDKMLALWGKAGKSRRIHIGMDETHDLGRGRFMDLNGYQKGYEIFNRHLARVNDMCASHGLKPMIWSDMYFRLCNKNNDYYDKSTVITDEVKSTIPKEVELVYWDYYNKDQDFYADWIERHRALGHEPLMGSGVWTWSRLWYDHRQTVDTVKPCIDACTERKVKELFFTMWGDDGAYCEYGSSLAGLCYGADLAYGNDAGEERMEKFFLALTGGSYKANLIASGMELYTDEGLFDNERLLWDDPMLWKAYRENEKLRPGVTKEIIANLERVLKELQPYENDCGGGRIRYAMTVVELLLAKARLHRNLMAAYRRGDREELRRVQRQELPAVRSLLRYFMAEFRDQWLSRNKPFGLESMQHRLGGQLVRYDELELRLDEYLTGKVASIPELDITLDESVKPFGGWGGYRYWTFGSLIN